MITLETLTAIAIKNLLSSGAYSKARALVAQVMNQTRQGNRIAGDVRGGNLYHSEVLVENGEVHATCTCPYDRGGYCKHVGALLLKWTDAPQSFQIIAGAAAALDRIEVAPPRSQKPSQMPPWLDLSYAAVQAAQQAQLHNILDLYRLQDLRSIAAQHNWPLRGTRKVEIVEQVAACFVDRVNSAALVAKLSPAQRATLNAVLIVGNVTTVEAEKVAALARHWHAKPADTQSLIETGLTHRAQLVNFFPPPAWGVLPEAVAGALQPQLALLAPAPAAPTEVVTAEPVQLLQQISQLLLLLAQQEPALTPPSPRLVLEKFHRSLRNWPYDAEEIIRLQQAGRLLPSASAGVSLSVPPPDYVLKDRMLSAHVGGIARLDFYYWLLRNCGLLYIGSPVHVWQEVQRHFVQRSLAEQHALLVHAYFEMQTWSELWEMLRQSPELRLLRVWSDYLQPAMLAASLYTLRQRVLRLLAALPARQWLAIAEIEALLRPIWASFDATAVESRVYRFNNQPPLWRLAWQGANADWAHGQRPFLHQVITTLHWLGLADIGRTDGQLTHVRLHGLAELFWLQPLEPLALPSGHAKLRAEGTQIFVAPSAVSGAAHTFLDSIGRLVRTDPTQFVYEMDPAAVHAVFEEGVSLNNLLHTWQEHFDAEPPATVRDQLTAWWASYGKVRIYDDVALIEFGDAHAFDEMRAVTSLDTHLIARLTPQVVLIKQAAVDILAAELQRAGYTPKIGA